MLIKLFKFSLSSNTKRAFYEKLLIQFLWLTSLFSLLYVGVSFFIDYKPGVIAMIINFVIFATTLFLFLKRIISYKLTANLYIANACFVAITTCTYFSGGISSPVSPWLILVPIFSLLLLGVVPTTFYWLGVAMVLILTFGTLALSGYQFPTEYNLEFENAFTLLCYVGLAMILLNIGSKYIEFDFSKTQEQWIKYNIGREILIFVIT